MAEKDDDEISIEEIRKVDIQEEIEEKLKQEIRHLKQEKKHQIAEILENSNNFQNFMLCLPLHLTDMKSDAFTKTDDYERKYTMEHVKAIQKASVYQKRQRLNGEILFDEWGTSGRHRPRVIHLLFCLDKVGLRRASNLLRDFIGIDEHYSDTIEYPSLETENDDESTQLTQERFNVELKVLQELSNDLTLVPDPSEGKLAPPPESLTDLNLKSFSYAEIKTKTNNFNQNKYQGFTSPGRFIGSGGFAKVFVAKDLVEDHLFVAVKVMNTKLMNDQNIKRFFRELKIISDINHENIIKLLGYSTEKEACLIYEHAACGSLKEILSKARRNTYVYDLKERVKNLWQISKALVYLHNDKRLVHRDIKPDNILLDGRTAKLCDFGLVKPQMKDNVTTTTNIGTLYYMPPEMRYNDVSFKVDVFAFGIVMLETLTSKPVYDKKRSDDPYLREFVKNRIKDSEKLHDFMLPFLLPSTHHWEVCLELITFALTCVRDDKTERPDMKFMNEKLLTGMSI